MQIKSFCLSFLIIFTLKASCEYKTNVPLITEMFMTLSEENFPLVYKQYNEHFIQFDFLDDEELLFDSNYEITHIFRKGDERLLYFYINPTLFKCAPSLQTMSDLILKEISKLNKFIISSSKELIFLKF